MPAAPKRSSDVPFVVGTDRYQLVVCARQGTSSTAPEFRYWYAGPPSWSEFMAGDTFYPNFHTLDESDYYTPGSVELSVKAWKVNQEVAIEGVLVEFTPRPSALNEAITDAYPLGFSAFVEGYGVADYSRVVSGSQSSGITKSAVCTFASTVAEQASVEWPNIRTAYLPCRLNQKVRSARVILTDIHLVEIVRVELMGTVVVGRL